MQIFYEINIVYMNEKLTLVKVNKVFLIKSLNIAIRNVYISTGYWEWMVVTEQALYVG